MFTKPLPWFIGRPSATSVWSTSSILSASSLSYHLFIFPRRSSGESVCVFLLRRQSDTWREKATLILASIQENNEKKSNMAIALTLWAGVCDSSCVLFQGISTKLQDRRGLTRRRLIFFPNEKSHIKQWLSQGNIFPHRAAPTQPRAGACRNDAIFSRDTIFHSAARRASIAREISEWHAIISIVASFLWRLSHHFLLFNSPIQIQMFVRPP